MHAVPQTNDSELDFRSFYEFYKPLVNSVVRSFRLTDAIADDLVQDIFLKAWKALYQLENGKILPGWIKTVARNECITAIRRLKTRQSWLLPMDSPASKTEPAIESKLAGLSLCQFEESLALIEVLIESHQHPIRREVVALFYREGCSIMVIAERLHLNPNTVLSHLRRFRLIAARVMQRWLEEQA